MHTPHEYNTQRGRTRDSLALDKKDERTKDNIKNKR